METFKKVSVGSLAVIGAVTVVVSIGLFVISGLQGVGMTKI